MNGDNDLPQRSSSPLKRRASSMDPETDTANQPNGVDSSTDQGLPRAMSIDPPDVQGRDDDNGQPSSKPASACYD